MCIKEIVNTIRGKSGGESVKKPMLTSEQLVQHMKKKGIMFNIISEVEAVDHLAQHNNYFKLTSYRKNYEKITSGKNAGKYASLEFAYLRELARIDADIRHLLLDMALDIEHFLKVMLINEVEKRIPQGEDGYKIISEFLFDEKNTNTDLRAEKSKKRAGGFHNKVIQNSKNPYCEGLVAKYSEEMPVWAYVELISFGDLKDLIEYYASEYNWITPVDIMSLDRVRQIRNACAHGNTIIYDLKPVEGKNNVSSAPRFITQFVSNAGVSPTMREKKLSNPRINQIVHLLYAYDKVVSGEYTRNGRIEELKTLINERIPEHGDYFKSNPLLTSTYVFFKKIVDTIN